VTSRSHLAGLLGAALAGARPTSRSRHPPGGLGRLGTVGYQAGVRVQALGRLEDSELAHGAVLEG